MQSKKNSHKEIITNQIVGIILGWLIVYFIFPLFGDMQALKATCSSIIFFVISYLRSYIIRRIFNKMEEK